MKKSTAGELIELMRHDKKAISGLTFVLDGLSGIEIVSGVDEAHLMQAFRRNATEREVIY